MARYIPMLNDDLAFAYPSRWMVSNLWENGTLCQDVMKWGTTNETLALTMCEEAGWQSEYAWNKATLWVKAALNMDRSDEFSELLELGILNWEELHDILYDNPENNLRDYVITCQKEISTAFSCAKPICSQREMLLRQWTAAEFTIAPSANMTKYGTLASDSMASWFVNRYPRKVEWLPSTETILPLATADRLLRYDGFLNQNYVK